MIPDNATVKKPKIAQRQAEKGPPKIIVEPSEAGDAIHSKAATIAVWRLTRLAGVFPEIMPALTDAMRSALIKARRFKLVARGEWIMIKIENQTCEIRMRLIDVATGEVEKSGMGTDIGGEDVPLRLIDEALNEPLAPSKKCIFLID